LGVAADSHIISYICIVGVLTDLCILAVVFLSVLDLVATAVA